MYMLSIIQNPPHYPPFFKGGEVNFNYLPPGGGGRESEKFLKGDGSGQVVFLKGGAGTYPIQFFQSLSFLHLDDIIFTFRNYFTLCLCKIVLCI